MSLRHTKTIVSALAVLLVVLIASPGWADEATHPRAYPVDFSGVVESVMPSLVKVENQTLRGHPPIAGIDKSAEVPAISEGAGFFIDKTGLILTNYHVVEGAESLHVVTKDQRGYDAELVGADPLTDLALIRIKPDFRVIPAVLGDSDKVKVGQPVLALGNPLGLDFLASSGIVSGFGPPGPDFVGFYDYIQVDVNIKPGNSGGPLLDTEGRVIGINYAYMGPGTGIGFAIPINRAREVLPTLKKGGRVQRGFLGVLGQPLTAGLAERLGLKHVSGALISDVLEGGPAYKGGLRQGDIVLTFAGKPVRDDRDLNEKIFTARPGKSASLTAWRGRKTIRFKVRLGRLEARSLAGQRVIKQCGLTLQEVTPDVVRKLGLSETGGLLVLKVTPGCPAYEGGLRFGDVIKKVEGTYVNTVSNFYRAYQATRAGSQALITVRRGNRPLYITLKHGNEP